MGQAKKKPRKQVKSGGQCLVEPCTREAKVRGLCLACYALQGYHNRLGHDALYWKGYGEATEMREARAEAFAPPKRTKKKPRRGLRAVK